MSSNFYQCQFKDFIEKINISVLYVFIEQPFQKDFYNIMFTPTKTESSFFDVNLGHNIDITSGGDRIWEITFNGYNLKDFGNKYDILEKDFLNELNLKFGSPTQNMNPTDETISIEWLTKRLNLIQYDSTAKSFTDPNSYSDEVFEKYNFRNKFSQQIFKFYHLFQEKLKGTISSIPKGSVNIQEDEKPIKKTKNPFTTKSFEIEIKEIGGGKLDDKLIEFHNYLKKNGFIEPIDYRKFKQAFTNQEVKEPIKWEGEPNELYYLIKNLNDKGAIKQFKNIWQVTCKCFILSDISRKPLTAKSLSHCHKPTQPTIIRQLNSAISTLI